MGLQRLIFGGSKSGVDDVRNAIGRAAQKTGVDFGYLYNQAKSESGLNPNAQASTSSAGGLFQFIDQSWLGAVKMYGAKHGLGWASDAISRRSDGSWKVDGEVKNAVMSLRNDPDASALMAGEWASDNADGLKSALGRQPRAADLYFAHFLGLQGATKFLKSADTNPEAIAANQFPREAQSNRGIFYDSAGNARTMGQVYQLMAKKISDDGLSIGTPSNGSNGLSADRLRLAYANEVFEGDGKNASTNDMLAMISGRGMNLLRPSPQTAQLAYMMLASGGDGSITELNSPKGSGSF